MGILTFFERQSSFEFLFLFFFLLFSIFQTFCYGNRSDKMPAKTRAEAESDSDNENNNNNFNNYKTCVTCMRRKYGSHWRSVAAADGAEDSDSDSDNDNNSRSRRSKSKGKKCGSRSRSR